MEKIENLAVEVEVKKGEESMNNVNTVILTGKVEAFDHDTIALDNGIVVNVPIELSVRLTNDAIKDGFDYIGHTVAIIGSVRRTQYDRSFETSIVAATVSVVK